MKFVLHPLKSADKTSNEYIISQKQEATKFILKQTFAEITEHNTLIKY